MTARLKRRRWWLVAFFVAIGLFVKGTFWLADNASGLPSWTKNLTDGFGGNVTSEILGGLLFLLLAFYVDATMEQNIEDIREVATATKEKSEQIQELAAATKQNSEEIREVATKSEQRLAERERILEDERAIFQFEQFMRKESYHDVVFPDLGPTRGLWGLEYTIEPVRDAKTGEPRKYQSEMTEAYIVRIRGPAHWEVMEPEDRKAYEDSPIRDAEYYFCQFYDRSWHMATGAIAPAYKFRLSGKTGPLEHGVSANEFMERFDDPFKGMNKIATILLNPDGTVFEGVGGCDACEIYTNSGGAPFLRVGRSLPKKMYFTNPANTYDDSQWFFTVENMRGYAHGQTLENMKKAVLDRLAILKVKPPKIPWYETDEHRFEPPT